MTGRIKIMKALGFKIGHFTVTSAFKATYARIKNAEIKSKSYTLEARRASRMRKKATNEPFAELEDYPSEICARFRRSNGIDVSRRDGLTNGEDFTIPPTPEHEDRYVIKAICYVKKIQEFLNKMKLMSLRAQ
ncbi:hypothetical protein TNCV_1187571 [Trichonephila clavipes]|nr:hypothetical protein TNCV_1187571 [Trichonephila clavipes]